MIFTYPLCCITDKRASLFCRSIHEPLSHLDDNSILEGQLLCFNQELDLLCSISVINWLIISGLLPLNYGADCKWMWWSSPLEATYTKWDTSCRFLPCLVTAHTLLWLPPNDVEEIFPRLAPFYHTFIILLDTESSQRMKIQPIIVQRIVWVLYFKTLSVHPKAGI